MKLLIIVLALSMSPLVGMESSRRSDGTLMVDGKAWFPFGYYHVSWIGDRYGSQRLADLQAIANSGGNAMHPTLVSDNPGLADFCSQASSRGVNLVAEIYWPGRRTEIPLLKEYGAIAAWNLADDVNWPPSAPAVTPSALLARHQEVKALDPRRLTYTAGVAEGYDLAAYAGKVDVFGIESYPIGNNGDDEALQAHYASCAKARAVFSGSNTTWILLPQTFAWSGQRYPTPVEVRNMIYAGLIEGAKGLICYTYYDVIGKTLPTEAPGLWSELTTITSEVRALEPILMDGLLSRPDTRAASAKCGLWVTADAAYVVVVNTSTTVTSTVSITLPTNLGTAAVPRFADRPSGLRITGGTLGGTIAPREVHVYRIANAATAAPAITAQPSSLTVIAPATATFTVAASGSPAPTYQWQSAAPDSSTFTAIGGATVASYSAGATSIAMSGIRYRCVATNSAGNATSNAATLTVTAAPAFTTHPGGATVTSPATATFTVAASGSPAPMFQWQTASPGSTTFNAISGATSASYTTGATSTAMSGTQYRCVATNSAGSATSNAATLTFSVWSTMDIGAVAAVGSSAFSGGIWTLRGSGADIWGTSDEFRFTSQAVSGDVVITARVTGLQNTNGWAKAGVMVRETVGATSRHGFTCLTASNGPAFQRRTTTAGSSSHTGGPALSPPGWVRLERIGNLFISSVSANGTTWTEIRRESVPMAAAVRVGLAVTSHADGTLCAATFSEVTVVGIQAAVN